MLLDSDLKMGTKLKNYNRDIDHFDKKMNDKTYIIFERINVDPDSSLA